MTIVWAFSFTMIGAFIQSVKYYTVGIGTVLKYIVILQGTWAGVDGLARIVAQEQRSRRPSLQAPGGQTIFSRLSP